MKFEFSSPANFDKMFRSPPKMGGWHRVPGGILSTRFENKKLKKSMEYETSRRDNPITPSIHKMVYHKEM